MWLFMIACSQQIKDSGSTVSETDKSATSYQASILLIDAMTNAPINEAAIMGDQDVEGTLSNDSGNAQVSVSENYVFQISLDGYSDHYYVGHTTQDFEIIALLASDALTTQIYGLLGLSVEPEKGTLVVALDNDDLSPAVGASATIDGNMSQAFVLNPTGASFGTVISNDTSSIVTFPNLPSGDYSINTLNSSGSPCMSYPSGGTTEQVISIVPGAVTVAVYTCP